MTLQYFDELWQQGNSDLEKQKKLWDLRAEEFNNYRQKTSEDRTDKLMKFFAHKGISLENSEILDIGCGAGQFAIAFAKKAKNVTGLDISPQMINYAKENAEREGVQNVQFYDLPWENINLDKLGWNKRFDLVIANMTPAVNSRQSLEKMMKASHSYGFISGFVDRDEKTKIHIEQNILNRSPNKEGHSKAIYYSFNILWLHGIHPEISYQTTISENDRSIEEAFIYYCSQFEFKGSLSDSQKNAILKYLQSIAVSGRVKDSFKSKTAWLFWENRNL